MVPSLCISRSILVVAVAAVVACVDEPAAPATCADFEGYTETPDIPLAYSTEHLDIHVDEDRFLCAGSAAEYERYYVDSAQELAIAEPHRTQVFLPSVLSDYCDSPACRTFDGLVFASVASTQHELAHAVTCDWRYRSSRAITEGVAVALEEQPLADKSDPREWLSVDQTAPLSYNQAGHFARWLLDEYGPEALRTLYRTAPIEGGEPVNEALEAVYDAHIDSLVADYLESSPDTWTPRHRCDEVAVLEPIEGEWLFESDFDCTQPNTFGPWERDGNGPTSHQLGETAMYQSFLLEIDSPETYRFERDDIDTGIVIERCLEPDGLDHSEAAALWWFEPLIPTLQGSTDVALAPGTYRVDVLRELSPPQAVSVRLAPNEG